MDRNGERHAFKERASAEEATEASLRSLRQKLYLILILYVRCYTGVIMREIKWNFPIVLAKTASCG